MITKFTIESIAAYATLAAIVGISSIFYTRIIGVIRAYFEKIRIPSFLKPVIGCAMVGIFAIGFPEILGTGYGLLQIVIIGNYEFLPIWILIAIIFVKMFATSISVGSGGGISFFGPTLVIGGLIGGSGNVSIPSVWSIHICRHTLCYFDKYVRVLCCGDKESIFFNRNGN